MSKLAIIFVWKGLGKPCKVRRDEVEDGDGCGEEDGTDIYNAE